MSCAAVLLVRLPPRYPCFTRVSEGAKTYCYTSSQPQFFYAELVVCCGCTASTPFLEIPVAPDHCPVVACHVFYMLSAYYAYAHRRGAFSALCSEL